MKCSRVTENLNKVVTNSFDLRIVLKLLTGSHFFRCVTWKVKSEFRDTFPLSDGSVGGPTGGSAHFQHLASTRLPLVITTKPLNELFSSPSAVVVSLYFNETLSCHFSVLVKAMLTESLNNKLF